MDAIWLRQHVLQWLPGSNEVSFWTWKLPNTNLTLVFVAVAMAPFFGR
jgi:hypothetical protein